MIERPVQIRNPEVVRDIRALSERLRMSMTDVVAEAVRRRLAEEMDGAREWADARRRRVAEAIAAIDALPELAEMPSDDDLYDEAGFPR